MSLFVIPFPVVDPVAFEIGPVAVRWYGLAYMAGLLFGWQYIRYLLRNEALWAGKPPAGPDVADDLLLWCTLGVVLGGRIGNVLFYDPSYYLSNPLEILMIWKGGMAFHGGLLGVILVAYLFARARKISFLSVGDLVCASVTVGLFFGRLANFINQEVVGRVTDVPWAMVFPVVDAQPRHPTQLYEAFLEGIVLFALCRYFTHRRNALLRPGLVSGVFFAGYGVARIFVENFRTYDPRHVLSTSLTTAGMVYSVPMVLLGVLLIWYANRRRAAAA